MPKTLTVYDDDGEEREITLPTVKEVCGTCRGEGKSSAYLGAFSREQMEEDPDFAEDYFRGFYDRTCDDCGGKRVIDVVDESRLDPATKKLWEDHLAEECSYRAQCEMERRMGA